MLEKYWVESDRKNPVESIILFTNINHILKLIIVCVTDVYLSDGCFHSVTGFNPSILAMDEYTCMSFSYSLLQ